MILVVRLVQAPQYTLKTNSWNIYDVIVNPTKFCRSRLENLRYLKLSFMKKQFKKWTFRLVITGLFLFALLVICMLDPIILYANKTVIGNYSIYHNKPLNKNFPDQLQHANSIIRSSELYVPDLKMDICLKDGSNYPKLIAKVMGKDFLSSFYNKIIFTGDLVNYEKNYIQLDGHKWNLTEMMAHAEVHCLEFNKYGLWQSNPIGNHPGWKWEGYPEFIARQNFGGQNLRKDIGTLSSKEGINNDGWMLLPDSTETLISFYKYRLLIQFCMNIKNMSFVQVLKDTAQEETVRQQMMAWYARQHS